MGARPVLMLERPPDRWERLGLVMDRGSAGEFDSGVTGDPCIVWDDAPGCYRMFYFAQTHVDGEEVNSIGHAVSRSADHVGPGDWCKQGPLTYANPEALYEGRGTHKPWVLADPYRPATPVTIDGEYWLFTVSYRGTNKVIQLATSGSLEGPWQVRPDPVVELGAAGTFDAYHVDTVTAYWFEDREEILLFYKGYPRLAQPDQPHSPYGASNAAAVMRPSDVTARKLGRVLSPSPSAGHWTAGWIGGLQILPASRGGWYGLLSASPTPPAPLEREPVMREPAPSMGGWAYTPEEWPVKGWDVAEEPIERIEDIPAEALEAGEGVNLWRHHVLILPAGDVVLYYNTGMYGHERMFGRWVPAARSTVLWKAR